MEKTKIFYSILSLSLILCGTLIPSVTAEKTDSITLGPSMSGKLTQNLNSGYKFTCKLTISGENDNDIKFWVTDPSGQTILDEGTVSQETVFEFTTEQSGAYTFNFDNSLSSAGSKVVTMSYDVEAVSIFDSVSNLWIGLFVVIVLVAIGLFVRARRLI